MNLLETIIETTNPIIELQFHTIEELKEYKKLRRYFVFPFREVFDITTGMAFIYLGYTLSIKRAAKTMHRGSKFKQNDISGDVDTRD